MALLGSLATGASGVKTQGKSMQVIGNNIANVNTFGFKRNNVAFEDLMGNQYPQGGSFTQVSNGVKIGSVEMEFSQGAFETTALATDMAIGGGGFFTVIDPATGAEAYTRNGQFSYDREGFLSTARGMRIQALEVDRNTGESKGLPGSLKVLGLVDPPSASGNGAMEQVSELQQTWMQMQVSKMCRSIRPTCSTQCTILRPRPPFMIPTGIRTPPPLLSGNVLTCQNK